MTNQTERGKRKRRRERAVVGGTARLTTPQTPPEGQNHSAGVIRPNTGMLRLPSDFTESNERRLVQLPGRVMLIITALALIFIILIAWFVAHEPPQEPRGSAPNEARQ
jgi:hypothetical protein